MTLIKKYNIHEGESSIIVLAKTFKVSICLANELKARKVMKSEGFEIVGTLGIILKAFHLGQITQNEALELLKYIQINPQIFRFNPKLIDKIIEKIV